jgi:cell division septation protein DedD
MKGWIVLKSARFELSLPQLAASAVVLLCLTIIAYVMGFHSGREQGMVLALDASERYVTKLPVEITADSHQGLNEVATDIYAKLSLEGYGDVSAEEAKGGGTDVAPLLPAGNEDPPAGVPSNPVAGTESSTEPRSLADRLRVERPRKVGEVENVPVAKALDQVALKEDDVPKVEQAKLKKGWFVQVSAPALESDAEVLSKKLRASGFAVIIEKAKVQERLYYRVLVGPEEVRLASERMLQQLLREKYIDKTPFIRHVK